MNDIAKLLTPVTTGTAPFPPDSRYHGLAQRQTTLPDGREVAYVARRFVPPPAAITPTTTHVVQGGDRLDLLAAQYFGNPTQGWKIVEANGVRDPRDVLRETGSRLAIGAASPLQSESFE
ncbi:MAG: LysM domain-containing protein [Pseudomonadota bacterium]